ncbi:DUF1643 domain-containing protein [Methylobacterium sp. 092160098-2]|uniref:DUF1643 domain-containing protein n=1 Tax=Methylobacterium sp. 092160098-2 TaxID=3025129 RepID=UPI002381A385|nr:DUF1643 domain-containing protein [Methylobacterium sp. 092160098-2]MDE4913478.1 DUF1643 domain-containing protein [Methylobacterium sp. 092160098-2]
MSAILSDEKPVPLYRYRLERSTSFADGKTAAVIMVNPSTADAVENDHTIRKVITFVQMAGASRLIVGNKFAFRAKDIRALRSAVDPIGPDNDRHLEQIMRDADLHIVAWGPLNKLPNDLRQRWRAVVEIARRVGCPLHALATAQCGHPRHPLMLGYACTLSPWNME